MEKPVPASTESALAGGCLCGKIRYTTSALPFASDYCHCSQCRKSSGAVTAVWMDFNREEVVWANAQPKEHASSTHVRRGFCDDCGCTLSYRHTGHPEYFSLTLATLDNPDEVAPTYHIHTSSAISWLKIDDALPRYAEQQTSEEK